MLTRLMISVLTIFLAGCGTMFKPYPRQMQSAEQNLINGQSDLTFSAIESDVLSDNPLLKKAEIARAYQWMGQIAESEKVLTEITDHVREESMEARLRMSKILAQTGSLMTNDNAIPYVFSPYETLLLYQYQALNYFAQGDVQNAFVSIRQADQAQKWLREDQAVIQESSEKNETKTKYKIDQEKYQAALDSVMQMSAGVKSSFDNPVIDYLSALMYQSTQDYSNAIVSIRHALGQSSHPLFKQKLAELLVCHGNTMQQELLTREYHLEGQPPPARPEDATVVIWLEQGLLMPKEETQLPLFLFPIGQVQMFSIPVYKGSIIPPPPLVVKEKGVMLGQTSSVLNIQALAAQHLREQMPIILAREVLRVLAKATATHAINHHNKSGTLGLAMQVLSLVTAHADLRSWALLPQSISLLELHMPAGDHELELELNGWSKKTILHMQPGSMQVLWMMEAGNSRTLKILSIK